MPDILIRGMEMPSKGCLRCPFNLYYANAVYCNCMIIKLLGKPSEAKYQNEVNCPLHELPEHGDLIDICNAENALFVAGNYHLNDYKKGWNDGIKAVIENAPVIVPASEEGEV